MSARYKTQFSSVYTYMSGLAEKKLCNFIQAFVGISRFEILVHVKTIIWAKIHRIRRYPTDKTHWLEYILSAG